MKIELEMKLKEEEDQDAKARLMTVGNAVKDQERHEVLFSPDCSSLYSCVRPEASYEYDYEINNIKFAEEKGEEFMCINAKSKLFGNKYIKKIS